MVQKSTRKQLTLLPDGGTGVKHLQLEPVVLSTLVSMNVKNNYSLEYWYI